MSLTSELRVALPRGCNHATTSQEPATGLATSVQRGTLKSLALLILQRNQHATVRIRSKQQEKDSILQKSCTKRLTVWPDSEEELRSWNQHVDARIEGRLNGRLDLPLDEATAEVYRRLCRDRVNRLQIIH